MHKVKFILLVTLTFISSLSFSQNERTVIDSLLNELESADDENKIEILNELSLKYWNFSLDSSLYFANEALNMAHIVQDKKGISDAYNRIGNVYSFQNENELALEFYQKCLDIRLELDDSKGVSNIYNNFAVAYSAENQLGIALEYYFKALKESKERNDKVDISLYYNAIANTYEQLPDYKNAIENFLLSLEITIEINDENTQALIYNRLGNIYHEISSYEEALKYFLDALELFEKHDRKDGISMIYNNLGIVYQSIKENDKALSYYEKSLEMDMESGFKEGQATAYNNIGTAYDEKGDKVRALEYYNKALDLNKELDITDGIATALNNIGLIYLDLGEYDKAYKNLWESTEISKELNDLYSLSNNYNNLANLFLHQKQYNEAKNYLELASDLAKKVNSKEWLSESYDLYSKLYTEQNDYKNAMEYYKLYSETKDSIYERASSNKMAEMKIKYETEFLETENKILKKDNEIHLLELQRQKNIKNYWIAFSILIFAMAGLGFNQVRLKKKTNNLLASKNNQLRDANKKLIESENNLKELNATKDKFFSIIAHDLKNPFQSLLGFSETLFNQLDDLEKDEVVEYSRLIYVSSQNLFDLLGNLLQWAKSQLGSMNLSPKDINLYESLDDVLSLLNISAEKKNITINNHISDDTVVFADKHVVSTLLRNLLSNAVKFTNIGGEIIISSTITEKDITISIKDNGKGIGKENIEKLFRIDQEFSTKGTENETGTGLGLILCKELITQSKGDISVNSILGKGSDFRFTLPLQE
ncbi:MAG: tetratricopeptide repeat-containing sensor histidine kinase [Bacteroidales bacterium]|nr:tetratricopeptide repeat-containing sensor histidine kinase [Bacteroidales bacterium]